MSISEWLLLDPSPNQLYVHWLIGSSHLINEYGLYVLSSFHSINAINFCGLKHYKRGPWFQAQWFWLIHRLIGFESIGRNCSISLTTFLYTRWIHWLLIGRKHWWTCQTSQIYSGTNCTVLLKAWMETYIQISGTCRWALFDLCSFNLLSESELKEQSNLVKHHTRDDHYHQLQ